ncbi:hypothetical protein POSPLADRAFT_1140646 [Postia placenta MAD-698-R-SB12]|uniref:O-methyltransferase C-terminal domain-containing protein n=1 Tax=Postia placenta MAD-698-R-SB12 TaxID=670580 RepID=A0A1X6N2Z2_9APHY|nr:hypothetical protein POSPLADRAFT_1140646 [Postia placenta MAD-698-R-SB12]OSX62842.1 hypothetical protein POSPLADRAFT_1140646 [Postia placenta MAD-698-R-SB12]
MASVAEKVQKLRALVSLLQDASETIIADWRADSAATDSGKDSVWNSSVPSPALYEARRVALGACGMYIDLVQDSATRLTEVASSYLPARALHIAVRAKIADFLASADQNEGIHIAVLSREVGIGEQKLLQILRCLACIHIFAEVQHNRFANTPTSMRIANDDLIRLHRTTEANVAAVNLPDVVLDPGKTFSTSIRDSAFNVTYGTDKPLFEYVEYAEEHGKDSTTSLPFTPPNVWAKGMVASGQLESVPIFADYPWGDLGKRVIVDVGGGIGGLSLQLAMRFPKLQFVVQDRPQMIQQAREAWEKDFPVALEEERVQFMAHDFFTEQTVREADVYVLRQILHDWPDDDCITILGHLRQAMRRDSCILVVDIIIHPSVGSSCLKDAPPPLLRNYGSAQLVGSTRDLAMLTLFNACERTPEHLSTLAMAAGLRLEKVWECRGMNHVTELRRDDTSPTFEAGSEPASSL